MCLRLKVLGETLPGRIWEPPVIIRWGIQVGTMVEGLGVWGHCSLTMEP